MDTEQFYKLKIIDGLHKDAELLLSPEITYSLGSSDDCDIILCDGGVAPKHLHIRIGPNQIQLETDAPICVDGGQVGHKKFTAADFQVITIGQAHLALGPANESWPAIAVPIIDPAVRLATSRELMRLDNDPDLPGQIEKPRYLNVALKALKAWLAQTDKKILFGVSAFVLVLSLFILDTWYSSSSGLTNSRARSILLSMVDSIMNVKQTTLIGTGLVEPVVATQTQPAAATVDPANHIRQALQKTWGPNLTETRRAENAIEFKGYDENNRADMLLTLERDKEGQALASGITMTLKKKKEILSQIGDILRVKVDAAEDMEGACKRILEKKGVRLADAQLDIENNSFTLQGESGDAETISAIYDIVSKAFPMIKVKNQVQLNYPEADKLKIAGVSTSAVPYVIQEDGSRVFIGGKLNNGCEVTGIESDHILLDCDGSKQRHDL
jgi:hypothetical protein